MKNNSIEAAEQKPYVVGVGASAGGLEALQSLLSSLPINLGFPYIIIQHLSPDYKSLLSEILSKHTKMPVIQAENGMMIKENTVYVIPPGKSLTLQDGRLSLFNQLPGALHLPIDTFFESLAKESEVNAIAVVLSGTGSDGTNGLKAVKERNGMVLVQSPDSAKFDGMPRSALRTGLVDFQGSPEQIAAEIKNISLVTNKGANTVERYQEINPTLMERIYFVLKRTSNINFTHYKRSTLLRRIERRMLIVRKDELSNYVDYLYDCPEEARILSREVLIGVTNFFRDPEYFDILQEKTIKSIVLNCSEDSEIRVWVAGCSTGEEAYSIAILFYEMMDRLGIRRTVRIFATDLDSEAIATAGKGIYDSNIAANVSAERLSRYFTRNDNTYTINRDIRKMLVFSPHNVVQDPPFAKLDLISCRNLLIYFEPVLQKDLFSIFHVALKDQGYLFLGKSEAVGSYTEVFPVVDAAAKIFTHRCNVKIRNAKPIPYLQNMIVNSMNDDDIYNQPIGRTETKKDLKQLAINAELLERFMPPCIIVDDKNDLVYVYGDCHKFISFPVGKVTHALFDIITESLRVPVSTILREARVNKKMMQYTKVPSDRDIMINLTALPLAENNDRPDCLYALILNELQDTAPISDAIPYETNRMSIQRITDLEQELALMQEHLHKSVSEQEIANEELQASNEELLTANEELQSSNEELQSVNEELYTVNSEYQTKLSELAEMNDDIANFLSTTLVGVIFVDSKLGIRRFTNYVTTEFKVLDQDIGRSIDFISYQFNNLCISEVCNKVIKTLLPDEREVDTISGKTFFMRVAPFRTSENKILGCVITFFDLTAQKQGRLELEAAEERLTIAQRNNVAKSDFLSLMSHEIRTPLNALSGLSEILLTQQDDKDAWMNSAKQISSTVKYVTSIISDILEMSKIERSQVDLLPLPFSLTELLERITIMMQPYMQEADLTFKTYFTGHFSPVYIGDSTKIQQFLINFLSNAQKYTPGGGTVTFKAKELTVENNTATLEFVISDTGIGISPEFLPDLFKPFTRESRQEKSKLSSMGLGLSIAYNLIKLMDGDVTVESKVDKGTVFHIRIKLLVTEESFLQSGALPEKSGNLAGCHVLVAEDNEMNLLVLSTILKNKGILFQTAQNGQEAMDIYLSAPAKSFDCILMDIRMPVQDGITTTVKIRESKKADAKTIPIIAISADALSSEVELAKDAGVTDYITKPINTEHLFELLSVYHKKKK